MTTGIDTNFIIHIRDQLEREIMTLENILEEKKKTFSQLTHIVFNCCDHEWVNDYIDTPTSTKHPTVCIKYCKKCELSDNTKIT